MKELILKIINDSNIELKKIDYKELEVYFSAFREEKMDFYLFLFLNYEDLMRIAENTDDIEYTLNRIAIEIQNEYLQDYKKKSIDKNLSFVMILSHTEESQLFNLKKIEENYFVAKKYLLIYNDSDFVELQEKINNVNNINVINSLNQLAIENGNLLNNLGENSWYILLLKLFTKLPFLNYKVADEEKQSLEDLNEAILSLLNDNQKQIFKLIEDDFYDINEGDIENFIQNNSLLDNTEQDEL